MNQGKRADGIKKLRSRIAAIRDAVLESINHPDRLPLIHGMPQSEHGSMADLSIEDRAMLAKIVASALDRGIHNLLYGLDNQPDGFEIKYEGESLIDSGLYLLSSSQPPIFEYSQFSENGSPRQS